MTPHEIRTAILASPALRTAIEAGNDELVARELNRWQPKERIELRLNELELIELYAPAQWSNALAVIDALQSSVMPLAVLVSRFMQPTSASKPDFGLAPIRQMLTDLGLTAQQVRPILDASLVEPRITANEVSAAVLDWRVNGRVGPIPGDAA